MNKTAVKRYWMEAEGPMGERIDSDESSVQVVLASDYDALKSREAVLVEALREIASESTGFAGGLDARGCAAKARAALAQVQP
jgi:hypothetical protein